MLVWIGEINIFERNDVILIIRKVGKFVMFCFFWVCFEGFSVWGWELLENVSGDNFLWG